MKVPTIKGSNLILKPFESDSEVDIYVSWMANDDLRALMETEKMGRDEVEAMRKRWEQEDDKFNFLICNSDGKMIGDIGLFFNRLDDEKNKNSVVDYSTGEISMMIAEENSRNSGLGGEAFDLMLEFAQRELGTKVIVAKIDENNQPSINFFLKKNFLITSRLDVFHEVHLERRI